MIAENKKRNYYDLVMALGRDMAETDPSMDQINDIVQCFPEMIEAIDDADLNEDQFQEKTQKILNSILYIFEGYLAKLLSRSEMKSFGEHIQCICKDECTCSYKKRIIEGRELFEGFKRVKKSLKFSRR
jgi:hypothetical protein